MDDKLIHFNVQAWESLWESIGCSCPLPFSFVARAYAEPQRFYHTANHIDAVLGHFKHWRHLAKDPQAVEIALWLHDIVYDPTARDNEAKSAEVAQTCFSIIGQPTRSHRVTEMIMATRDHDYSIANDIAMVVDIDMSILAVPSEQYTKYLKAIRKEYSWVPDSQFQEARISIIEKWLSKDSLYAIPELKNKWELRARENLLSEFNNQKS